MIIIISIKRVVNTLTHKSMNKYQMSNILTQLFELSQANDAALEAKAKEHKISLSILKQVYKRGLAAAASGAVSSGHAYAMGRVNSFCTGDGGARKADADLWSKR